MTRTLVITGASGYIGSVLVAQARAAGWRVIAATRRRPPVDVEWLPYALDAALAPERLPEGAIVVHLAADTSAAAAAEALEVAAIERLLAAAALRSVRVLFISSQTARLDAPTPYGRAKAQVERRVLARGGTAIRPGFVYGGAPAGVFGSVVALVRRAPVLPRLMPAPIVQPIHVTDLCTAILRLAEGSAGVGGVVQLGAPQPVPLHRFLQQVASHRLRIRRWMVPIPTACVRAALRLLPSRAAGLRNRVRSLLELPMMDTAGDLAALGVVLRPLAEGLAPRGDERRRGLLIEGDAFISYALRARAPRCLVKRYVGVIERLRNARPLRIPPSFARHPRAVLLLDVRRDGAAPELDWRLDAAVALAEASPEGAHTLLGFGDRGAAGAILHLAGALLHEAAVRALGLWSRAARRRASAA